MIRYVWDIHIHSIRSLLHFLLMYTVLRLPLHHPVYLQITMHVLLSQTDVYEIHTNYSISPDVHLSGRFPVVVCDSKNSSGLLWVLHWLSEVQKLSKSLFTEISCATRQNDTGSTWCKTVQHRLRSLLINTAASSASFVFDTLIWSWFHEMVRSVDETEASFIRTGVTSAKTGILFSGSSCWTIFLYQ